MYLYETHLPVRSTEASQAFYIEAVSLEFAYRDPTRDIVFLWIGRNKRSAQLYFRDPDGHSLEFITVLDDKPDPQFLGSLGVAKQKLAITCG